MQEFMLMECGHEIQLSGTQVYPVNEGYSTVRIPDKLIKSVGFVSRYEPTDGDITPMRYGGTAFIVGVRTDANNGVAHLVTAKHVAEAIEPAEAVIAMNAKDGAPLFLRTGNQEWFYHPTEKDSVDVAVMPFGSARFHDYDITWIPEGIFATETRIAEFDIGLGDELVAIGLFTRFFGSTHLIPLVRTGNLAMMPKDKIPTKKFGAMEAYLAEGRSIGGLSGSPVFVRNTVNMPTKTASGAPAHISGLGSLHFLGLMQGHWETPTSFSDIEEMEAVNMGVSIIVPAKKILEVLYHPELVAMRKKHYEENQKDSSYPTTDSAFKQPIASEKPFTKVDFETALKKASRKGRS
jgi:hypothetical protein